LELLTTVGILQRSMISAACCTIDYSQSGNHLVSFEYKLFACS